MTKKNTLKFYDFGDILVEADKKLYYENKKLISYKNIKLPKEGLFKVYLESGKLFLEITYLNGEKNGIAKCYYPESTTVNWVNYYTNDKLNGICQEMNEKGMLIKEDTFTNGIKDGVERRYENDNIIEETMYKHNEKNGFHREFYKNYKVKNECTYKNDLLDGYFISYDKDGEIITKTKYRKGSEV